VHGHATCSPTGLKTRMGFDGLVVSDWDGSMRFGMFQRIACPRHQCGGSDRSWSPSNEKASFAKYRCAGSCRRQSPCHGIRRLPSPGFCVLKCAPADSRKGVHLAPSRPTKRKRSALRASGRRARGGSQGRPLLLKNDKCLVDAVPPKGPCIGRGRLRGQQRQAVGGWRISWRELVIPMRTSGRHPLFDGIRSAVTAAGGTAN